MMSGTGPETVNNKEQAPTRIYLSRLVELLSEVADRDTVMQAIRSARGFAGGKSEKKKKKREYVEEEPQVHFDVMTEDEDHYIEYIEIRDPKLPVRFEKTDERVNFREATDPSLTCNDCVFFKKYTDEADGIHSCALVEGRIREKDTCDLIMKAETEFGFQEDMSQEKVIAEVPKIESIDERQVYDLGAISDHQTVVLFTQLPIEQFSEVPNVIPLLPMPGVYHHPRYGDIAITKDRNARFVDHINTNVYQEYIPIDAEHQGKLSGAFGFIVSAKLNEDGSADAEVEWSDRGRKVLSEKRFRYISPEWLLKYEDPASGDIFDDVVIGAALTTRPFFKEPALRPIIANDHGLWDVQQYTSDDEGNVHELYMCSKMEAHETVASIEDERSPEVGNQNVSQAASEEVVEEPAVEPEATTEATAAQSHSEAEPSVETTEPVQRLAEDPEAFNELPEYVRHAFTELRSRLDQQEQENQAFRAQVARADQIIETMQKEQRTERFTAMVTGRDGIDSGAPWFGEVKKHVNMLEKLSAAFGEESEEFTDYCETHRAIAQQQQQSEIFREVGNPMKGGTTAWGRIQAMAEELMKESTEPMTMSQAITKVTEIHPELHREDLAERGLH